MYNGHIDKKPVGVLDKWVYPPFDAVIKDGKMFA